MERKLHLSEHCSTLFSRSADHHVAGDVDLLVQSLGNPEPNQTKPKPKSSHKLNKFSKSGSDPSFWHDCIVKAILFRKLSNSLRYFHRNLSHEKFFYKSRATLRIWSVAESEDRTENSCSTALFHTHLALGQLILTLLVTLTGMFKACEIQSQTTPSQNLLINGISFPNPDWTILLTCSTLGSGSDDPHLAGDVDRLDGAGGPRQDAGNRSLNTHIALHSNTIHYEQRSDLG